MSHGTERVVQLSHGMPGTPKGTPARSRPFRFKIHQRKTAVMCVLRVRVLGKFGTPQRRPPGTSHAPHLTVAWDVPSAVPWGIQHVPWDSNGHPSPTWPIGTAIGRPIGASNNIRPCPPSSRCSNAVDYIIMQVMEQIL